MIRDRKGVYLEYASSAFLLFSFFYFSNVFYHKFIKNASKIECSQDLKNFDIYKTILKKYDAKIIDLKVVNGYVEAFIAKENFNHKDFENKEPFLIECLDDHYLVTFKNVKNVDKKKIENRGLISINNIKVESVFFYNSNNWFVSINGKMFDINNKKISENAEIVSISKGILIIKIEDKNQSFSF